MSNKVHQYLTQRVMTMLENGVVPWRRPWNMNREIRAMNISGNEYRGINYFLMNMLGHETPIYLTFNQIKKAGGKIKEGAEKRYYPVYFYSFNKYEDDNGKEKTIPLFRYYNVWNIEDVEGVKIPKKIQDRLDKVGTDEYAHNPVESAESIIKGMPNAPQMKQGYNRACYIPALDMIQVPDKSQFKDVAKYYSTMFHEMGHSTGAKSRLNRKGITDPIMFASHEYSREELVAEMTAAMLSDHAGLDTSNSLDNSVAYLAGWMRKIKDEPNVFAQAAGRAQRAVDYILGTTFED